MTDHENTGQESLGSYSLDGEDQLQPGDTLDDRGVDDLLDEGYSPPERPRGVNAFGTTASEQRQRESIEQRFAHEEPDPASTYENRLDDSNRVGGDDPDAIAAEDDFLGDGEVGNRRSGRLKAHEKDTGDEDSGWDMAAEDVGIDGGGSSAEEAAMHIIEDETR